jgi:hypothetical protein
MLCLLAAGVAHARLFAPPAPNVAYSGTWISADTGAAPVLPQQVLVDVQGPERPAASGGGAALGVALVAAGVGVVAGRHAMLFLSGGKNRPKKGGKFDRVDAGRLYTSGKAGSAKTGIGAPNESNPYQFARPNWTKRGNSSIQTQKNGFGTFIQAFQKRDGKSKYGVPIFLPNGNVNPAYLAAERADIQAQSKRNSRATEAKRKNLLKNNKFQLADYLRSEIGPAGSGKEYYQSGR